MPDSPPENNNRKEENIWRQIGRYSNLAFVLPAAIVAGLVIGHLLDRWLNTSWITLTGLFVGCFAGFAALIRGIIQSSKES
ncbi:MAG TPA: AtpZ/AtpI family protein [Candidatus Angelobacter sp.]|nr:AtpZ/AtpI family protein [Candidatus Angelobacter sp.]